MWNKLVVTHIQTTVIVPSELISYVPILYLQNFLWFHNFPPSVYTRLTSFYFFSFVHVLLCAYFCLFLCHYFCVRQFSPTFHYRICQWINMNESSGPPVHLLCNSVFTQKASAYYFHRRYTHQVHQPLHNRSKQKVNSTCTITQLHLTNIA